MGGSGPQGESERDAELARLRDEVADLRIEAETLRLGLEHERTRHDREMAIARRIQLGIIPGAAPDLAGWQIDCAYRPARIIGGDFYDHYRLGAPGGRGERLGLVIADVTGKGLTAALMMAFSRAVLRSAAYNAGGPADALERTNRVLVSDTRTGLFVTAWLATLDGRTGRLRYATAGHELPLIVRAGSRRVSELASGGPLLGAFARLGVGEREVRLRPGDLVVAYTDGVTDAMDRRRRRFGAARLRRVVREACSRDPSTVLGEILAAVDDWSAGEPQADDVTMLAIHRTLPAEA